LGTNLAVIVLIIVCSLLFLGILVDYVKNIRANKRAILNKKRLRLRAILFRAQRLLNGRSLLPLTVGSSIVCLERTLVVLNSLLNLKAIKNIQEVKVDIQQKLTNFRTQANSEEHFYSTLAIPYEYSEQLAMLKQSILLTMTLRVDKDKGYYSNIVLQDELAQLAILQDRLRASLLNYQAIKELECKQYEKAIALNNQAIKLLAEVESENESLIDLLKVTIEDIQSRNDAIEAVIVEKSHDFYEKLKEEPRQLTDSIHDTDDGLDRIFDPQYTR